MADNILQVPLIDYCSKILFLKRPAFQARIPSDYKR